MFEYLSSPTIPAMVLRLLLACLCGGIIGYERSKKLVKAGVRTHCIIAAASALFMIVSKYGFFDIPLIDSGLNKIDASRIASGVVTGIGFLGAAVIFRDGLALKGLSTAAGIWATGAIGLSIGGCMFIPALALTLLVVIIQVICTRFGGDAYSDSRITIVAKLTDHFSQHFFPLMEKEKVQVLNAGYTREDDGSILQTVTIHPQRDYNITTYEHLFIDFPEIRSISKS